MDPLFMHDELLEGALLEMRRAFFDDADRPVAFRLSRLGASFLGLIPAGELEASPTHLIVDPDDEVVLFPGGNEYALIHALDRFCVREKKGSVETKELRALLRAQGFLVE